MKKNEVDSVWKLERFLNEVQNLCDVFHQNIIRIKYINIDAVFQDQRGLR